jgi:hypothetical protein
MQFILNGQTYEGETAVEIVRRMESACFGYERRDEPVRDFLVWSLECMSDRIPARELDVSPKLDDETIAFNFLCLLDGLKIGSLFQHSASVVDSPQ